MSEAAAPFTLLLVDDEANILSSLRRLFRPHGYRVFTAEGGPAGLAVLEKEAVDLVISDMRMPEMSGAQFLGESRKRWPDMIRILLTGYADLASTIEAINSGQIHRYLSKPWNDEEVVAVVAQALERKALERENQRLGGVVQRQNEELKALNAGLEAKVEERTREVAAAHEKLKAGFINAIKTFSNLMELRGGGMAGRSRRVADTARRLCQELQLPAVEAQDIFFAALLHDIGQLGLADEILAKPFNALSADERNEYVKHPAKGAALLMGLEQLRGAIPAIRGHHERWDGQGYPDKLAGLAIPMGARILAVASDFDAMQQGLLFNRRASADEALDLLVAARGKRYDPRVVDAMLGLIRGKPAPAAESSAQERIVATKDLTAGMVLARDLLTRDGVMLLARDYLLDEVLIRQIRDFENAEDVNLKVHVIVR